MRLAIFILLSSATMVAATDQYQVQIVRTSTSSNIIDNCKEPVRVLKVDFQTLVLKSGATYERRPVSEAMADYIESTAVELGVGPDLLPCSKEAGRTGHNTFMIRQGKCLASNFSVSESCAGTDEEVVYSAADLLSPDVGLPVSEISNLAVSLEAELGKIKVTVVFDEGSLLPDLYFYRLEFDGRTEVVASGSEIIVEDLTSCIDLVFTLTPYIRNDEKWGSSAVYQLRIDEIPPPEFDTEADAVNNEPWNLTFILTDFVKDPCHTVVSYTISLSESVLLYANKTLQFSGDEAEIVLTCDQVGGFSELDFDIKTIEGVEAPEKYNMVPNLFQGSLKLFDANTGLCWLAVVESGYEIAHTICEPFGGKHMGKVQMSQETIDYHVLSWLLLAFNTSAGIWQWDDGSFLSTDDPLWSQGKGIPAKGENPYYNFETGLIYLTDQSSDVMCYLEEDQ